jgi:hypothetical protein
MKNDPLTPGERAFRALQADPERYHEWAEQVRNEWAARQPPQRTATPVDRATQMSKGAEARGKSGAHPMTASSVRDAAPPSAPEGSR